MSIKKCKRISPSENCATMTVLDNIQLNSKGGVLVTKSDIEMAYEFFDPERTGKITGKKIKERYFALDKKISKKEIQVLLNGKNEIAIQDLHDLLIDNVVKGYDARHEAFKFFDKKGCGFIENESFQNIFSKLGYGGMISMS